MMTLAEFRARAAAHTGFKHRIIPVYRRLPADLLTPVSALIRLRRPGNYAFLLESVEGGEHLARYTFLGCDPFFIVRAHGTTITVQGRQGTEEIHGNIFHVLQKYLDRHEEVPVPGLPRLRCGAVGFMGYDCVRLIERLPMAPPDALQMPDALWCFYDTMAAFDRVKHQMILMASAFIGPDDHLEAAYQEAVDRLSALEGALRSPLLIPEPVSLPRRRLQSNFERSAFERAVAEAKRLIYEGDIFQVALSQRYSLRFGGDPFNLYRALRQINPSPYLFYLEFGAVTLVGSSPEVLVRMEDGRARLLPIAGTRPRGMDDEEDVRLAEELLQDPKERAEHLMLVDLARNDLGRICQVGTVQVDRYAYIERYSHVMHIVSAVSGAVAPDATPLSVLRACFPAGTVSGAPKVRAMEIIDTLEPERRGVYAGAIGYIDYSGNMDTCIAIRTIVIVGQHAYIQVGAGIVADSDPAREYEETENKARALKSALLRAADGQV